jgi:hypothetical protein
LLSGLSPVRESGLNKHLRHKTERVCIDGAFGVDSRSKCADFVVFIPARSLRRSTSYCDDATFAIRDERDEEVEPSAPFPFAFLFAFSVPR